MSVPLEQVFELGIEENLVFDRDFLSKWEALALWQVQILRRFGLEPHHRVLDVGCGPMRLGGHLVDFLDDDRYYGIDAFDPYMRMAPRVLELFGLHKPVHLLCDQTFAFDRFGARFDFAIAQSVVTHLSRAETARCIENLAKVMEADGKFIFTYIVSGRTTGRLYGGTYPIRAGRIPSHQHFADLASSLGLSFEMVKTDHPTGQSVGLIRFNPE